MDQTDLPFKRFADKIPPAEVMYTIIADLRAAVSEFARALSLMFTPLRAGGQAPSIADLLHIVGLDSGVGEADEILARDLGSLFSEEAVAPGP